MKKDIHPKLYKECVVTCACGNTFTTISALPSISVEICSACHPFYTGQRRFVDTERRIDKFTKKAKIAEEKKKSTEEHRKNKESKKVSSKTPRKEQTVKEMLDKIKSEEN
ncbi:MAG TPA: 50S ribosomal protein L31 [bacterium]|jgi:large subunit ribosomal protein L31|nr:50S ribosomal protein L31 [bacterium]HOA18294.1 50S ribosomal protein L31 [bacterium]